MIIEAIRKAMLFSLRSGWRYACQHPFVMGLLSFMLFLYRYFPSIFAFVVYSSPVIVCTAFLLGALLVYGEPYIPQAEDVNSGNASVKVGTVAGDVVMKGDRYISEMNVRRKKLMSATRDGSFRRMHDEGDGNDIIDSAARASLKNAEKETHKEKKVTDEVEAHGLNLFVKNVFSIEKQAECALPIAEGLKVEIEKPSENQFESSLGSPWQQVDNHEGSSDSESDREDSLSPCTSMTDIIPIIDELHPLLESENPRLADRSIDTSDAVSRASSPDHESDDDSIEEETENQVDEEDEEAREEKDNNDAIVKWTADDQKNLMDLGSSELERNQRLENLIAKRRARKLQRFQTDKNLIDLDNDPLPFMEEISRLNIQVPAISAPRHNPFDLPYDSEESRGLPPIPGSAPSVLLPRRNPFDLPFVQDDERGRPTGESSRPSDESVSRGDMFVRRNDRLNPGAVSEDVSQEKHESKFKPYFVAEKVSGTGFVSLERQLSEKSDSEESSTSASESDSASSVVNPDNELSEQETHEPISSVNQDVEFVEEESESSDEVGSDHVEQEENGADTVEVEIVEEVGSGLPVSIAANLEVIEERYEASGSSSCSEGEEKYHDTRIDKEPINPAQTMDNSPRNSGLPAQSVIVEPSVPGKIVEGSEYIHVADPVYDSSPSSKSISRIPSIDEALFSEGKEGLNAGSSLASDMLANLPEQVSPPKAVEMGTNSDEGDLSLVSESTPAVLQGSHTDGARTGQEIVEKIEGSEYEASDGVDSKLREIKSANDVSDSDKSFVGTVHVEKLNPDNQVQELRSKSSRRLDSSMDDSCTEEQDSATGYDAGASVEQLSNLNSSFDQHSVTGQHEVFEYGSGSSNPFPGHLETSSANLHAPESSVVDKNDPVQQSSQQI